MKQSGTANPMQSFISLKHVLLHRQDSMQLESFTIKPFREQALAYVIKVPLICILQGSQRLALMHAELHLDGSQSQLTPDFPAPSEAAVCADLIDLCKSCCIDDSTEDEEQLKYKKAVLEVCSYRIR